MLFRHFKSDPPLWYNKFKKSVNEPSTFYRFIDGNKFKGGDYYRFELENNSWFYDEIVSVPCGKCVGCSMDYSKQWATRCYLESLQYNDNYFVTLTYDDNHLPKGPLNNGTLNPDDLKKFIKDVRNYWMNNFKHIGVRYFAAGEYGSTGYRPHYHILFFNLPLQDLVDEVPYCDPVTGVTRLSKKVVNGEVYQWSEILSSIWNKGQVVVGKVSYRSCAYTARYVVKKARGSDKEFMINKLGILPEFVRMSTRPGLGSNYCLSNLAHMFEFDSISVPTGDKVINNSLPRYFMNLIKNLDSDNFDLLHEEHRKALAESLDRIYHSYNLKYFDYLELKEKQHIEKIKLLKRSL